ncbi:hypothetical protein ACWDG1_45570 [Streptomyces sp. NPDC001177]
MDCEQAHSEMAIVAFGLLADARKAAVTTHMTVCSSCCGEFAEFAALMPLLDTVMLYELDGVPSPDPERAVAAARREDSLRRSAPEAAADD